MGLRVKSTNWVEEIKRQREEITEEIARELSNNYPDLFSGGTLSGEKRQEVEKIVRDTVYLRKDLQPGEHDEVINSIIGQMTGYGPLEPFFTNIGAEEITEVNVNPSADGKPKVFYIKNGEQLFAGNHYFRDNDELTRFCQKICEDIGRTFTDESPEVDAWMADGSRVNVTGFKMSPLGTSLSIRKSPLVRPPMPMPKLVDSETFPYFVMNLLIDLIVHGHANAGFFGRTDSGKTTFLRALCEYINKMERVIIGETSYEVSLPNHPNVINYVEVTIGGKQVKTMTDICKTILRNNPDRAIVGEIRGGEAVAASEIAESISSGFMTTGHAENVKDLRSRLPKMFAGGGMRLDKDMIDEQLRTMFDFLVFLDKDFSEKKTLMSIVEVTDEGYKTIIRFDEEEFNRTNGNTRRWIYENPVSRERLNRLAFRGANIKDEYREVHKTELYVDDE
ncbi:MAG: Flp pilus assembly complex ATPase component TadA [Clostridiales bacterium]|nr:Flp pilus assembly complex ATPase component TadA [Clostridiales bacterium]MCF8022686.1 Flp pilus assembly complex ATPase component TadA [Clostridiales bacterium]